MARLSARPLRNTALDHDLWVDREAELSRLRRAVRLDVNAAVFGDRRSGKTSLLRRLETQLRDEGRDVVVIEGHLATDAVELLSLVRFRLERPREADPATVAAGVAADVQSLSAGRLAVAPRGPNGDAETLLEHIDALTSTLRGRAPRILLVDGLPMGEAGHVLFGRLRDELWELPLLWLVFVDSSVERALMRPPADAFFDVVVRLTPLEDAVAYELLRRRVAVGEASDATLLHVIELAGGNPGRLIALARDQLLADDGAVVAAALDAERRHVAARLGDAAERIVEELEANGPASASDPRLLSRVGVGRSRAAQLLGELERSGVLSSHDESGGRGRPRKIYEVVS